MQIKATREDCHTPTSLAKIKKADNIMDYGNPYIPGGSINGTTKKKKMVQPFKKTIWS